jgi:hypothetical protein
MSNTYPVRCKAVSNGPQQSEMIGHVFH